MHNLTNHQVEIANKLLANVYLAMDKKTTPFVGLSGQAGVGKTFTTQNLCKLLSGKYSIYATAPTHKAVKVLSENLKHFRNVQKSTIHSFLKLKLKPDYQTGLQVLVEEWGGGSPADTTDILIVDECSQVSGELLSHIYKAWKKGRFKVALFVGDHVQLKPVDSNETNIFNAIPFYDLQEVMRQSLDNPIIANATDIRYRIESAQYKEISSLINPDGDKINIFSDGAEFVKAYLADESQDKIVCSFTNSVVDSYNRAIRKRIKGDVEYIIEGDTLVFQDTYAIKQKILHFNNDEVDVHSATIKYDKTCDVEYWHVYPTEGESFKVVDINCLDRWHDFLSKLREDALNPSNKNTKRSWATYYDFKGRYAEVKYNYACTLHKLQGSTYEHVYFDMRSLKKYYDMDTVYRLIYVALTRASKKIFIFI